MILIGFSKAILLTFALSNTSNSDTATKYLNIQVARLESELRTYKHAQDSLVQAQATVHETKPTVKIDPKHTYLSPSDFDEILTSNDNFINELVEDTHE